MTDEHEDPAAHAGSKIGQWVILAATAAEALAQVTALRVRVRAERDERAAANLRAGHNARYGQARLAWRAMLDPRAHTHADFWETGQAWAAAQAWCGDPEADQAATLATERLRELRPDEMRLYDRAVAEGADPVEAMRDVAPLMDRVRARHGDPAPARRAITTDADVSATVAVRPRGTLATRTASDAATDCFPVALAEMTAAAAVAASAAAAQPAATVTQPQQTAVAVRQ